MSDPVLVTGASGSLGRVLLELLGQRDVPTRCLVHRRPVEGSAGSVRGDLADLGSLERAVAGAGAVVHLAALTHARVAGAYDEVNLRGTQRLLGAAETAGVRRFVHVSTRAVSPGGGAYSRSKAAAEAAVAAAALDTVIVRLPELYGAGGTEGVDRICALALQGSAIPVVGRGQHELRPLHVGDAAQALAGALEAAPGTYTLGGPPVSVREFAERCIAASGSASRLRFVPRGAVAMAGRLGRILPLPVYPDQLARLEAPKPAVTPSAETSLGFRSRSLDEGLAAAATSS